MVAVVLTKVREIRFFNSQGFKDLESKSRRREEIGNYEKLFEDLMRETTFADYSFVGYRVSIYRSGATGCS